MLTHKPVNRYLASKDAESAGAAAPDGASPRRLRTPPPTQWRQRSASPAGCSLTSLSNVLHRSAAALSKNTSMAVLFLIKSTAILVFSHRKSSVPVGMFCVTITFDLMQPWNPMPRYCFFCRNLVLSPVLRLFPAGRRCSSWRMSSPLSSP